MSTSTQKKHSEQKVNLSPAKTFSLLWPGDKYQHVSKLSPAIDESTIKDLELPNTINAFSKVQREQHDIEKILCYLCDDPEVITYRQDVIEDFLKYPFIVHELDALIPNLSAFGESNFSKLADGKSLYEVTWRLGELESYVECIECLFRIFDKIEGKLCSAALIYLRDFVLEVHEDEAYKTLVKELPDLLSKIRGIQSVTIGVNLDHKLQPVQATLVSINKEQYTSATLMDKLFGHNRNKAIEGMLEDTIFNKMIVGKKDKFSGIAKMHKVPEKNLMFDGTSVRMDPDTCGYAVEPKMVPLFKDLAEVLENTSRPIVKALKQFINIKTTFLVYLKRDLTFYLGAIRLIKSIGDCGLPMCRPQIHPKEERIFTVKDCFNVNLPTALLKNHEPDEIKNAVVGNDISFNEEGRIMILTGPNRGGKTTYTQCIGLAFILAQAGLYIPGTEAKISPVDTIFTHFPVEEKIDRGTGRLGDEAKRFNYIFTNVTPYSLVLLNESLSSTNAGESLYLAEDIVKVLKLVGLRAVFATHLHELASNLDDLNAMEGDAKVISMVSMVNEGSDKNNVQRTYKVIKSPPMGHSYALQIAKNYGISYDQLTGLLNERNII